MRLKSVVSSFFHLILRCDAIEVALGSLDTAAAAFVGQEWPDEPRACTGEELTLPYGGALRLQPEAPDHPSRAIKRVSGQPSLFRESVFYPHSIFLFWHRCIILAAPLRLSCHSLPRTRSSAQQPRTC